MLCDTLKHRYRVFPEECFVDDVCAQTCKPILIYLEYILPYPKQLAGKFYSRVNVNITMLYVKMLLIRTKSRFTSL